jgi:hypothetical protein
MWLVLAFGTTAALFVGRQKPPPLYLALLHLTECEFPCWIGIVPGETTFAEARERIIAVYGTGLTRYGTNNAFTVVDLLSNPIDLTSDDVSIRVGDDTYFIRISLHVDKTGIVSDIFFEFLLGHFRLAQLQSFLASPLLFEASSAGIYQLMYSGAIVVGDWKNCEAHQLTLELNSAPSAKIYLTRMSRWAGWRNLQRLTECW